MKNIIKVLMTVLVVTAKSTSATKNEVEQNPIVDLVQGQLRAFRPKLGEQATIAVFQPEDPKWFKDSSKSPKSAKEPRLIVQVHHIEKKPRNRHPQSYYDEPSDFYDDHDFLDVQSNRNRFRRPPPTNIKRPNDRFHERDDSASYTSHLDNDQDEDYDLDFNSKYQYNDQAYDNIDDDNDNEDSDYYIDYNDDDDSNIVINRRPMTTTTKPTRKPTTRPTRKRRPSPQVTTTTNKRVNIRQQLPKLPTNESKFDLNQQQDNLGEQLQQQQQSLQESSVPYQQIKLPQIHVIAEHHHTIQSAATTEATTTTTTTTNKTTPQRKPNKRPISRRPLRHDFNSETHFIQHPQGNPVVPTKEILMPFEKLTTTDPMHDEPPTIATETAIPTTDTGLMQLFVPQRYYQILGSNSYLALNNNGKFLLRNARVLNPDQTEPSTEDAISTMPPPITTISSDQTTQIGSVAVIDSKTEPSVQPNRPILVEVKKPIKHLLRSEIVQSKPNGHFIVKSELI